jgi:hypothetical protein
MPHGVRAFFEERLAFELLTLFPHVLSWRPAKLPGFAKIRAGSVSHASRHSRCSLACGAERARSAGPGSFAGTGINASNLNASALEVKATYDGESDRQLKRLYVGTREWA